MRKDNVVVMPPVISRIATKTTSRVFTCFTIITGRVVHFFATSGVGPIHRRSVVRPWSLRRTRKEFFLELSPSSFLFLAARMLLVAIPLFLVASCS